MRLFLTLALALSALTAASRSSVEKEPHASNSRNLLEAAKKEVPPAGLKGKEWANTHLDKHAKSPFGHTEKNVRRRDQNGQLIAEAKGKKTPLADPNRYESESMVKFRLKQHGLTSTGQLANPVKRGRSPLTNPLRYGSPALKRARIEQHSGQK
ncbi:hypothetical protein Ae201684P_017394 [Aphanomyces euteiches]|uniref:RxLR effector protein n=1 Tax=Aphanomyces euteiches TaxID=100861 RepID=A0A6G0W769_9STRA|nr:hypothetical protein Ae201684_018798 [Aphanomyces euteiches]KAH9051914.1 hypothetical protein Ae201684P_017394 [Aphanomyces euteiches]